MKVLVFLFLGFVTAFAAAEEIQLGIVLGSNSGISAKFELGGNRAIDAVLAYSSDSTYGTYLHADYLFEKMRQFSLDKVSPLYLYYGPGLKIVNIRSGIDSGRTKVAFRAPIGVNLQTSNPNLEFFGDVAPTVDLTPSTSVYIDVGIGLRFRF